MCPVDHTLKESNYSMFCFVFFSTGVSVLRSTCNLQLFYLILPGKLIFFCPVCKRQQIRCHCCFQHVLFLSLAYFFPLYIGCGNYSGGQVSAHHKSWLAGWQEGGKQHPSNPSNFYFVLENSPSPMSTPALPLYTGMVCSRVIMSNPDYSWFPSRVYLNFCLHLLEKTKARSKI